MAYAETENLQIYGTFQQLLDDFAHDRCKNIKYILGQVKELNINTEDRLNGVANIVFEKVSKDLPTKASIYAKLCAHMIFGILDCNIPVQSDQENQEKTPANIFQELIINRSQKQFQIFANSDVSETILKLESELANCTEDRKRKIIKVTLAEEEAKVVRSGRAICNFIGVLYGEKILTGRIIVHCLNLLIDINQDEKLECLCQLLKSCGHQLNFEAGMRKEVDDILDKLHDILVQSENGTIKIGHRASFAIQNTLKRMKHSIEKKVKPTDTFVKKESIKKLAEITNGVNPVNQKDADSKNEEKNPGPQSCKMADDENESMQIYNTFHQLLYDLAHKKNKEFKHVVQPINDLNINTEDRLNGIAKIVFEQVTKDLPSKAGIYAKLCAHMIFDVLERDITVESQPENIKETPANIFRKLIIKNIQEQFEIFANSDVSETILKLESELAHCTEDRKRKIIKVTLAEEEAKVVRTGKAICNFIGEMYGEKLLTGKIIVHCLNLLIGKNQDEKLECLCQLLRSSVRYLNSEASVKVKEEVDVIINSLRNIFEQSKNGTVIIGRRASFSIENTLKSVKPPKAKEAKPTKKLKKIFFKKTTNKKLAEVLREIKNDVSHLMENEPEGTENHHALIGLHNKCEEGLRIIAGSNNPATYYKVKNPVKQKFTDGKSDGKNQACQGNGDNTS